MSKSNLNHPYHGMIEDYRTPQAFRNIAERAAMVDPVTTDIELAWLSQHWVRDFTVLALNLRLDRSGKKIFCLPDHPEGIAMLETINERLAQLQRVTENSKPAVKPEPKELVAVIQEKVLKELAVAAPSALVEEVSNKIARAVGGKTIGLKLLETERSRLQQLMAKHNVRSLKAAVLVCINLGLEAWEKV